MNIDRSWTAFTPGDWRGRGVTEPWTLSVVAALLTAIGGERVLEIGTSEGISSLLFCRTLARMGGGTFIGLEPDQTLRMACQRRLSVETLPAVQWTIHQRYGASWLSEYDGAGFDLVWVDGDHTIGTVQEELGLIRRHINPGGLICGHDVFGEYELESVWPAMGGTNLRFALLYGSGGLGIWQAPS